MPNYKSFTMENYQREEDTKVQVEKAQRELTKDTDRCLRCMKANCYGCKFNYDEEDK